MELFSVMILLLTGSCFGEGVQVATKQGTVKGRIERSRGGRNFQAFYRIPYAEPPIGDLRFEHPIPHKPWNGVWDATVLPPACLYQMGGRVFGDEDCLYLNLYRPQVKMDTLLPVMVFIYGGRFMYGDALPDRYGPHYLMDKDIIVITFHYRQGPFGFLSTEDEFFPGNYGLKDVVAVLKWVQENIESFGGDKNRVTIAGGSSGGVASSLTLISPLAKGLFHRCISHSGFATDFQRPGVGRAQAWRFASLVGCDNDDVNNSRELKSCLKKVPAHVMAENIENSYTLRDIAPPFPFGPVVETEKVPGAFMVDYPTKLLPRNTDIPWLLGMNSDEGGMNTIFAYFNHANDRRSLEELNKNYLQYFPAMLNFESRIKDPQMLSNVSETVKRRYFGNDQIIQNYRAFSRLNTDKFLWLMRQAIELYRGPKYVYYYDHKNEQSFDTMYGNPPEDLGVLHGDELISVFNWSQVITPVTEGIDFTVSEQILNMWVNFATYGNPNGEGKKVWHAVKSSNTEYLYIKDGLLEMRTNLLNSDFEFWKNLS